MESIEASGKSVDEAVKQGLARLGKRRDEVEITVLQEPSRGAFGLGSRDARATCREARDQGPEESGDRGEGAMAVLESLQVAFNDPLRVRTDVHEYEREDPNREHRERHADACVEGAHSADRQADEDRRASDRTQADCLCEWEG